MDFDSLPAKDPKIFSRLPDTFNTDATGHHVDIYSPSFSNICDAFGGSGSSISNGGNGRHRKKGGSRCKEPPRPATPPSQRVRFLLGDQAGGSADGLGHGHEPHPLFSEMEELYTDEGGNLEWKETARWIKFEEEVEEGSDRWSKPHVATLSLHSLFDLRSLLLTSCCMLLDMDATNLEDVVDLCLDALVGSDRISFDLRAAAKDALMRTHRHQHEGRKARDSAASKSLPLIRSLADIGKWGMVQAAGNGKGQLRKTQTDVCTLQRSESNQSQKSNSSEGSEVTECKAPPNKHFMKKIPKDSEAANILVGTLEVLDKPICCFIRLNEAVPLGDLTEVPLPTRFIFIFMGPKLSEEGKNRYHEVGRSMATVLADDVFHELAYKAKNRDHLLAGLDEFLGSVVVLPPGEWDPSIRIEPPASVPSQSKRRGGNEEHPGGVAGSGLSGSGGFGGSAGWLKSEAEIRLAERRASGLVHSGRLFGGLAADIRRKLPWYVSDFRDGLDNVQCVASFVFIYFAVLAPVVTFGGLLGEATEGRIGVIEALVGGMAVGVVYGLFSGQPLSILGPTGPILVFETIVYQVCKSNGWEFLACRLWIGAWVGLFLLVGVATDASALVCFITRFTEENFAFLIAVIFIKSSVEKLVSLWHHCHYAPNVFLASLLLFSFTYLLATKLKRFRGASFFPASTRAIVADFAVILALVCATIADWILQVPDSVTPTWEGRHGQWMIEPFPESNPWWIPIAAAAPAILATILVFMDQQITVVIVNRKEHKLKKGCGYHLDLFVVAVMVVVCSFFGFPWCEASTVPAINHVKSLMRESEGSAPGEKPQFLGIREQRVTHVMVFIFIGLSAFMAPVLGLIPMPVLFGVFLYMGMASLDGIQFFDRLKLVFMPKKYQPDLPYLRRVPLARVHLFTGIQALCCTVLWIVKDIKETSILFPVMLVVMIGVRKLLEYRFSKAELMILDDIFPSFKRSAQLDEEDRKSNREADTVSLRLADGALEVPMSNGKVIKIPVNPVNITEEMDKSGLWKSMEGSVVTLEHEKHHRRHRSKKRHKGNRHKNREKVEEVDEEDDDDEGLSMKPLESCNAAFV